MSVTVSSCMEASDIASDMVEVVMVLIDMLCRSDGVMNEATQSK